MYRRCHGIAIILTLLAVSAIAEEPPSLADVEQGYIQRETPTFELPSTAGERYDDTVPATLDLAAMADKLLLQN